LIDYSATGVRPDYPEYGSQPVFLDAVNGDLEYYDDISRSNNDNRPDGDESYDGPNSDVFYGDDEDFSARKKKPGKKKPFKKRPPKKKR